MSKEETLRENKRECFDGMRAYHQSEISHANHAITMLLAMTAGAGAIILAILFPENLPSNVHEIAWGLFFVVTILGITIAGTAHLKIEGDHEVYASFGAEYVRTCELLGLYEKDYFSPEGGSTKHDGIKKSKAIGQGKGYRKTQLIIWSFTGVLVFLTLLFAIAVPT